MQRRFVKQLANTMLPMALFHSLARQRFIGALVAVLMIGGWFLYFAGGGLSASFSGDDLMNLHGYLSKPVLTLLADNLSYWSTSYRPLGGLFYTGFYTLFGFNPLPFRIGCFVLMGLNLVLLFRFCRLLSDSSEVAFLATFLGSYHAWFVDLYYSSGTVYDLLCFCFYLGVFNLYAGIRRAGRLPRLWESLLLAALYICALNAKEMAVTLPLALLIYECLYHRPNLSTGPWTWLLREGRMVLILGLLTVPYIAIKLTGSGSLVENPAYQLSISPVRFLKTFHLYLNPFFYREHVFHDSNTIQLLLLMLAVAVWRRSRSLIFAWCFVLFTLLPVAFIAHYAAFFLYIPSAGWALYIAEILIMLRRVLALAIARLFLLVKVSSRGVFPIAVTTARTILFVGIACVLVPFHLRETSKTRQIFSRAQPPVRAMTAQLLRVEPHLPPSAHVLFVDDPFPKDQYFLVYLTRLVYHDMSIEVSRTSVQPCPIADYGKYDAVLSLRQNTLTRLN
jgi:dolichyl-phosphate-mannose-protein mannosyltransferase